MKFNILKLSALFAFAFFMTACQKDDPEQDLDTDSAQTLSNANSVMDDLDDEATYRMAAESATGDCPTVTYAQAKGTFPNTVTIDYGSEGCPGPLGHIRKGKIIVDLTDQYFTPGAIRTVTPDGFSVDDWSIEGQRTVTNLGENNEGDLHWSIVVNNATVTDPEGNTGNWSTSRIRTLVEGYETEGIEDDIYEITGSANGTNRRGKTWEASIVTPLVKPMSCRWVVSGTVELSVVGQSGVRSLDFGNGECDNKGVVTFPRGYQKEITLRR